WLIHLNRKTVTRLLFTRHLSTLLVTRANKGLFLAIFLSFFLFIFISPFIEDLVIPNLFFKDLPAKLLIEIIYLIVFIHFHRRMWAATYDENVKATPTVAVILLLIPIIGFIWMFEFYFGYVKRYRDYIIRYGLESEVLPLPLRGLMFYTLPILISICCLFLMLSLSVPEMEWPFILSGAISYIVFLIIVWETCDSVNSLADAMETSKDNA
ncbi:MAG: hypothetical protein JW885_04785, partial [Deltaproteobacteria bacterium]|nr:hypothetical protein [Candidatus Zymogenaceae bacterium]